MKCVQTFEFLLRDELQGDLIDPSIKCITIIKLGCNEGMNYFSHLAKMGLNLAICLKWKKFVFKTEMICSVV